MSLAAPHHDGSELYVVDRPTELGGEATVRLRVPRGTTADEVGLRYVRDGEPRAVRAEIDEETETETWWRATFPVGLVDHDIPDADDFVLSLAPEGPEWHLR